MPRFYIGGPSGCGKTAAIKIIKEKFPWISCQSGSGVMMKAAGVTSRKELEQIPEIYLQNLRKLAFKKYYQTEPNLICEGHYFLTDTDFKYIDKFFLLEVPIEKLVEFRLLDSTRSRSTIMSEIEEEINDLNKKVESFEKRFKIKVIKLSNDSSLENLVSKVMNFYFKSSTSRKPIINH
jgi:broad-specificity NMP kinase